MRNIKDAHEWNWLPGLFEGYANR